jgi:UDPglucose 6-dehydrogenase
MREIYRPLSLNQPPLVIVGRRTSELTKYAANAFLAMKITFINEIADLCEKAGADVQEVARGVGLDKRIGGKFLHAGPGYGGSCFPKDTRALVKTGEDFGAPQTLVARVDAVNEARKESMAERVIAAAGGDVAGKRVAVLGLAFKPNTDDMRDAPSLALIAALRRAGADVHAHDPEAMEQARPLLPDVTLHDDPYDAIARAHALVLVTEWDAFRALDLDRVRQSLAEPVVVDLRNVYAPAEMRRRGFRYASVGRA